MTPGTILFDPCFYRDEKGSCKPKYLVVLAAYPRGVIWRTLTSRRHGRPTEPRCCHDAPYSSFYLGVIDPHAHLGKDSWVDLQAADDFDDQELTARMDKGQVRVVSHVLDALICPLLECAAGSRDTTRAQERHLRDVLATLRS